MATRKKASGRTPSRGGGSTESLGNCPHISTRSLAPPMHQVAPCTTVHHDLCVHLHLKWCITVMVHRIAPVHHGGCATARVLPVCTCTEMHHCYIASGCTVQHHV